MTLLKSIILIFVLNVALIAQQSTTGKKAGIDLFRGSQNISRTQVIISDVPSYIWRHGCGPTALGMVVGYYDLHGFSNLIEGDATYQTDSVDDAIANEMHYDDYSSPEDSYPNLLLDNSSNGGAHESNCLGDFMETSWSSENNYYGWSWSNKIDDSFNEYVEFIDSGYSTVTTYDYFSYSSWENYKEEIDNNRPVVLLVDTDGDGYTDHFVTGIGYDDSNDQYGIYDTWDNSIHWFEWQQMSSSNSWGIYGFNLFQIVDNSGIEDNCQLSIVNYQLKQNYPNPFNPTTKINFELAVNSEQLAEIVVCNMKGQEVWSSPVTRYGISPVTGSILFDGSSLNSGIYYYSLIIDSKIVETKSMILIK